MRVKTVSIPPGDILSLLYQFSDDGTKPCQSGVACCLLCQNVDRSNSAAVPVGLSMTRLLYCLLRYAISRGTSATTTVKATISAAVCTS